MSKESHIKPSDDWFKAEKKTLKFLIVDDAGAAIDVSSYTMTWVIEHRGADILAKSGAAITVADGDGTNDAVTVTIDAADTESLEARVYRHALRRTDSGSEQVLSYGEAHLLSAPAAD